MNDPKDNHYEWCVRGSAIPTREFLVHAGARWVGSLVYTQADNRYGFSPRGTYLIARDQKDTGT